MKKILLNTITAAVLTVGLTGCADDLNISSIDPQSKPGASDMELLAKCYSTLGVTGQKGPAGNADLATIAELYGIDEQSVYDTFAQSVVVSKLRDSVCETELPEQPAEPAEPEEGAEDTPTADYASYIIALLGDEWDSEAGTWARTDGDYYATLSTYEITNDAATYAAAEAAYNVAYSAYSDASTQLTEEWTTYTGNLLSHATIQIGTLAAS